MESTHEKFPLESSYPLDNVDSRDKIDSEHNLPAVNGGYMEILMRSGGIGKWKKITEQKFENEAALQNILYESPEIIPIDKLGENVAKPKVFIKEAGLPGSGNTDLIGIDKEGGISIIECKLATNSEIRRKVIGQLLEYAAYLWQLTYEKFDIICSRAEKWGEKHLADVMRGIIEEETNEPWSEEDFRYRISSSLEKGDFRLVIAVDSLNDELRRIIQFLNTRRDQALKIYALEMRQFSASGHQLLVPELFGVSPVEPAESVPIPAITEHIQGADSAIRPHLERLHTTLISRFGLVPRSTRRTIAYDLPGMTGSQGSWMAVWPGLRANKIEVQISRRLVENGGGNPENLYQHFIQEGLEALPPAKVQQTLLISESTDLDNWLEVFEHQGIPNLVKQS